MVELVKSPLWYQSAAMPITTKGNRSNARAAALAANPPTARFQYLLT